MSISSIGSSPMMVALAQSGQAQAPPPPVDPSNDGDTSAAKKASPPDGIGQSVDKSA